MSGGSQFNEMDHGLGWSGLELDGGDSRVDTCASWPNVQGSIQGGFVRMQGSGFDRGALGFDTRDSSICTSGAGAVVLGEESFGKWQSTTDTSGAGADAQVSVQGESSGIQDSM